VELKVNMNGLRSVLAFKYNTVVETINYNIKNDETTIEIDDIKDDLNELGNTIGALLCIFDENDESFVDLCNKVEVLRIHEDDEDEEEL